MVSSGSFAEVVDKVAEGCFFRMEHSGASLAWFYFNYDRNDPFYESNGLIPSKHATLNPY